MRSTGRGGPLGLFFEVFAQRGTAFAPALAAHDTIARDCYAAVRAASPRMLPGPLVKPLTYMEHGYSPATMRRGVTLSRLLGERNPFPLIRIPWDSDRPWQAVFLHEVAHNLQADLGLWVENRNAVLQRLAGAGMSPRVVSIFGRWQKEIFADLAAVLLGGPGVAWGMAGFLAHPHEKVMTPAAPSTKPSWRSISLRMRTPELARVWARLYDPLRGHRLPKELLAEARRTVPAVVDEIAFQSRRNLAARALAGIIPLDATTRQRSAGAASAWREANGPPTCRPAFWSAPAGTRSRPVAGPKCSPG